MAATEFPEAPNVNEVYLIGEGTHQWFASFLCPCECGEIIKLSTLPEGRPRWTVAIHVNGTVTIHPSIRRTVGCRSHFFLRRGQVIWS